MSGIKLNQVVWFWRNGMVDGSRPEPAIVTRVLNEEGAVVDVWVFCSHGAQREEAGVAVLVEGENSPRVRFVTVLRSPPSTEPAMAAGVRRAGGAAADF